MTHSDTVAGYLAESCNTIVQVCQKNGNPREEITWKKSNDSPILSNIAGSSEDSTTGTPWFMMTGRGRGCISIDDVRHYHPLASYLL